MPRARSAVQKANALITLFVGLYKTQYGKDPIVNRYTEQWGFQSMIEDLTEPRAVEVIEYYFTTKRVSHSVQWLLRNYHRLNQFMIEKEQDEKERLRLRIETAQRVKEWEARNDARTESN